MNDCFVFDKKVSLHDDDILRKPDIIFTERINKENLCTFNPRLMTANPKMDGGPSVLGPIAQKIFKTAAEKTIREAAIFNQRDIGQHDFDLSITQLVERGLLIVGEESEPDFDQIPNSLRTLKVYLIVTDKCNILCPHCLVKKGNLSMSFEIGKKAIDSIMASARKRGFGYVKIFFFGGEPLLEWELVKRLLDYAGKNYGKEIEQNRLQFMLITNGTLLNSGMTEYFVRYKVMVLISVGNALNQNTDREKTKKLWDALQLFHDTFEKKAFIAPTITATLENAEHLPEITRLLLSWGIRRIRFALLRFSNYYPFPGQDFLEKYTEKTIHSLSECFQLIEDDLWKKEVDTKPVTSPYGVGFNYFLDNISLHGRRKICGAESSLFSINQLGNICSCHLVLDNPLGYMNDDILATIQRQKIQKPAFAIPICKDCELRFSCSGHCQRSTLCATGQNGPSVNCAIYKELIPKWYRLRGIFIMKKPLPPHYIG